MSARWASGFFCCRTFWTSLPVIWLVLQEDPGTCKARFLIVNAELFPNSLFWTVWLKVNVFQIRVVNQTAVTFLHAYSVSTLHSSCLYSMDCPFSLSKSSQQNVAISFSDRHCFLVSFPLYACLCHSSCIFCLGALPLPLSCLLPYIPFSSGCWQSLTFL